MKTRIILLLQLVGTLAIIAWFPSNLGKAVAMITLWLLTFGKLRPREMVLYVAACLFFSVMDVLTVQKGQFAFNHPDLLGLPLFEFLMWGFYLLHAWRMLGDAGPQKTDKKVWVLAICFGACFTLFPDPTTLFAVTAALLAVGMCCYRERLDWAYVVYLMLMGASVELVGVHSGQWHYPTNPAIGMPLWFMTMWGGIGLFLRRLVLPTLNTLVNKTSQRTTARMGTKSMTAKQAAN